MNDLFWLVPGKIAGMSHPGTREVVWEALKKAGIGAVVTLTLRPLNPAMLKKYGFESLHLPIRDFAAPTHSQINLFVDFCERQADENKAVMVHCRAGIGRTGVMLACYLVHKGVSANNAIKQVRLIRPGALETVTQENAVYEFHTRQ